MRRVIYNVLMYYNEAQSPLEVKSPTILDLICSKEFVLYS